MWRTTLSSHLRALRSAAAASPALRRPSAALLPRYFAAGSDNVVSTMRVEDVMPIATGHEREELEAELQGKNLLEINYPEGPFGIKLRKEDLANQPSDVHNQNQGFLQDTGAQVGNMVQGAADIGKGAAATVVSVARGTALGAANLAEGAAHAVKNTLGTDNPNATSHPSNPTSKRA